MRLYTLMEKLEAADGLDRVAEPVQGVVQKVIPVGSLKDALSGTWLGHPVHPLLVSLPIGTWVSALVLDLTAGRDPGRHAAADALVGLGVLSALPTAASGASDWAETAGAERRVGLVHAIGNYAAVGLQAASWLARRRGSRARGITLSLLANALVGATGYLGGHMSYAQGVGVDTTAFQAGPQRWTALVDDAEVVEGRPVAVDAEGVRLVVVRDAGRLHALADRCTHRGGPLHEGEVAGGCITCPWHASAFRLDDGAIERGPAVHPQPVYETRVVAGRVEVRRVETRTLRTNPV